MSQKRARAARQAASETNGKSTKGTRNVSSKPGQGRAFWVALMSCILVILVAAIVSTAMSAPGSADADTFPYSEGIAANGFWEDISALEHVELFAYQPFSIPKEVHEISDGDLQSALGSLYAGYDPDMRMVTDRAVLAGDIVNIDYIGSVDGVPFDNGSTEGFGTDVTAGSTDYIDDFLTQIIGRMPGETFDVEVTFPEDYGQDHLNGMDAVFLTTINYITEYDITDSFVAENLYDAYGWETVRDMEDATREDMQKSAIDNYVWSHMATGATVLDMPEAILQYQGKLVEYQEQGMLDYYLEMADSYEMDLEDFLQIYVGVSGVDALLAQNREGIATDILRTLVVQAIAEDAGLSVSNADLELHLPDYTSYEGQFGMPWIRQYVLGRMVHELIIENAVFAQ